MGWVERSSRRAFTLGMLSTVASTMALGRTANALSPSLAKNWTVDRQIGQMLVLGFWGSDKNSDGAKQIATWLAEGKIGGVIFFQDNLTSPTATKSLTDAFIRSAPHIPPLLCVDQEGGIVSRLQATHGFAGLPSAQNVAASSPDAARALYNQSADELSHLQFNVNFGPVVDLALNPKNRIIEGLGRSYGADPKVVDEYARAFIDSYRSKHILTAIKHFPGHGSTPADSHASLPDISSVWSEAELIPFRDLIKQSPSVDMVMIGHLTNSRLFGTDLPASLSRQAIEGVLRQRLGFDGVVVTDDMDMGAIRNSFTPDQSILMGVNAGADLFVYSNREYKDSEMPDRFIEVVKRGVTDKKISSGRIEESVARILRLKDKLVAR